MITIIIVIGVCTQCTFRRFRASIPFDDPVPRPQPSGLVALAWSVGWSGAHDLPSSYTRAQLRVIINVS